jgi:hypothetical protein
VLIITAQGAEQIRSKYLEKTPLLGLCMVILIVCSPLYNLAKLTFKPFEGAETKQMIEHLADNMQDDDFLFVGRGGIRSFNYYADRYGLEVVNRIDGLKLNHNITGHTDLLDSLKGKKRTWVLLTHTKTKNGINVEMFTLFYLERFAKKIDILENDTASLYLFVQPQ